MSSILLLLKLETTKLIKLCFCWTKLRKVTLIMRDKLFSNSLCLPVYNRREIDIIDFS